MTYIDEVLRLYVRLSDTPSHPRPLDRILAAQLQQQLVPIEIIRAALLIGAIRHAAPDRPRLQPIRSLHYFLPIIEEIRPDPIEPGYLAYLEHCLARLSR